MGIYDDIDADVLRNYQEFALVNVIYLALRESSTSEQSARMTAMDSASKNACKTLPAGFRYLISLYIGSFFWFYKVLSARSVFKTVF